MKPILISIQKHHTDNIKARIKTIEVRKGKPNQATPFPCFIYETKAKGGCGKVIGEFVCARIIHITPFRLDIVEFEKQSCLTALEIARYLKGLYGYGWHISDLKIYDKPKELGEFRKPCCYTDGSYCLGNKCEYYGDYSGKCFHKVERPPQSWCYVEEI